MNDVYVCNACCKGEDNCCKLIVPNESYKPTKCPFEYADSEWRKEENNDS